MTNSRVPEETPRIDFGAPGIPGGQAMEVEGIPPEYWRAFSLLAFAMNRFIVDHMIRSARLFDNDTEELVLFGMLAHLNIVHLVPPGSSAVATLDHQGRIKSRQSKLRPVRLRDLAQITGRPRETIRRKLERMRAAGRVQRLSGGWVYNDSSVDANMQALTMDSVVRFLQAADAMRAIARDTASSARAEGAATGGPSPRTGGPG